MTLIQRPGAPRGAPGRVCHNCRWFHAAQPVRVADGMTLGACHRQTPSRITGHPHVFSGEWCEAWEPTHRSEACAPSCTA